MTADAISSPKSGSSPSPSSAQDQRPAQDQWPAHDQRPAKDRCPACLHGDCHDFFTVREIPVHVCVLGRTREEALAATRGDITLSQCGRCSHIFNRTYEASKVVFDPSYEASLEHSPTFRDHIEQTASRLVAQHGIRNQQIIEVGCGSGFFLTTICRAGANRGVGFDPSVVQGEVTHLSESVRLVRDFYDSRFASLDCDFLCCLSVIEGIEEPLHFLQGIRDVLGQRQVACYFEIFNGQRPFTSQEPFSIHYEQCNYFTKQSFAQLVTGSGFTILRAGECYQGDQYLYIDALTSNGGHSEERPAPGSEEREVAVDTFRGIHRAKTESWEQRLQKLVEQGRKAVVWGSGGKGVSFLNMLPTREAIEYVVDINPRRQGMFIPGSGQEIVSPEFLVEYRPDDVFVTNALYEQEIRNQLASLNLTPAVTAI